MKGEFRVSKCAWVVGVSLAIAGCAYILPADGRLEGAWTGPIASFEFNGKSFSGTDIYGTTIAGTYGANTAVSPNQIDLHVAQSNDVTAQVPATLKGLYIVNGNSFDLYVNHVGFGRPATTSVAQYHWAMVRDTGEKSPSELGNDLTGGPALADLLHGE